MLEYDETLEVIQPSTGTPKVDDTFAETVFLRVLNNKVSDRCVVETSDHVAVTLSYSMRVSFDGESSRWFNVENYVKFLCDHVRSVLKGTAKKHAIEAFYARSVEVIRDAILGQPEARAGMIFAENGMHVTDVEVLDVTIDDEGIATLLGDAQHEAVEANIAALRASRGLELTEKREAIPARRGRSTRGDDAPALRARGRGDERSSARGARGDPGRARSGRCAEAGSARTQRDHGCRSRLRARTKARCSGARHRDSIGAPDPRACRVARRGRRRGAAVRRGAGRIQRGAARTVETTRCSPRSPRR